MHAGGQPAWSAQLSAESHARVARRSKKGRVEFCSIFEIFVQHLASVGGLEVVAALGLLSTGMRDAVKRSCWAVDFSELRRAVSLEHVVSFIDLFPRANVVGFRLHGEAVDDLLVLVSDEKAPLHALRRLELGTTNATLEPLGSLTTLAHLDVEISFCRAPCQLAHVAPLLNLVTLKLRACYAFEGTFEPLANLRKLETLLIDGFAELARCETIDAAPLSKLTTLRSLSLTNCRRLNGDLFEHVRHLKELRHLDTSNCSSLRGTLEPLSALTRLEHLKVRECFQLAGPLACVAKMPRLKSLNIRSCYQLRDSTAAVAGCKELESLNLSGMMTMQIYGAVSDLATLPKLRQLVLENCPKVTGRSDVIEALFPRLSRYNINGCTAIAIADAIANAALADAAAGCGASSSPWAHSHQAGT
ncbi:hypothetical protein M885DRAFT_533441 [Pelagophyceae sp. CCMP2097]|nr:hypothetical protein M885DRAFT_533441 [Pelagophyceae sp. CCMP2097]